jgi:hypothetical protein
MGEGCGLSIVGSAGVQPGWGWQARNVVLIHTGPSDSRRSEMAAPRLNRGTTRYRTLLRAFGVIIADDGWGFAVKVLRLPAPYSVVPTALFLLLNAYGLVPNAFCPSAGGFLSAGLWRNYG